MTKKEKDHQYYLDHQEKVKARSKKYYYDNRVECLVKNNKYYAKNSEEIKSNVRKRDLGILYDLTSDQYNKMLEEQQDCCKICGRPKTDFKRSLAVDHNHTTGVVRGLLCLNCNDMIGRARDSVILLQKGIEYLQKYGEG